MISVSSSSTGGGQDNVDRLPLSRRVGFVCGKNVLAHNGCVRACGRLPEGALRKQRSGGGPF